LENGDLHYDCLYSSQDPEVSNIEITRQYKVGDNQTDPEYNKALSFLHEQISQIEVCLS
jgi:hypothetical protein